MPTNSFQMMDPRVSPDSYGVFHVQSGSPVIGAGVGSYPFVTVDIDGQPRDGHPDTGADEFSHAQVRAHFLTTNDVGVASGMESGGSGLGITLSAARMNGRR